MTAQLLVEVASGRPARESGALHAVPADTCTGHRPLLDRLVALEDGTDEHVHEEDHVLSPTAPRTRDEPAGAAR
ncbi:MAG: hypothetical protein AB7L84_03430 [Acidimicrobiia bacterium]